MPAPKTGHQMKLYRNAGTIATPSWQLICAVGDVSIPDLTRGMAELKSRCSQFTKNLASIIQSISVEFRLFHGMDPTNFDLIRADFFAGTVTQWAVMDGPIATNGSEGLTLPALVESFPWDQPLEDVSGHDVRLAVAYMEESSVEIDPAWLVVGG